MAQRQPGRLSSPASSLCWALRCSSPTSPIPPGAPWGLPVRPQHLQALVAGLPLLVHRGGKEGRLSAAHQRQ